MRKSGSRTSASSDSESRDSGDLRAIRAQYRDGGWRYRSEFVRRLSAPRVLHLPSLKKLAGLPTKTPIALKIAVTFSSSLSLAASCSAGTPAVTTSSYSFGSGAATLDSSPLPTSMAKKPAIADPVTHQPLAPYLPTLLRAKIRWLHASASMDTEAFGLCQRLLSHILRAVLDIGPRLTVSNHGRADVLSVHPANSDSPAITVRRYPLTAWCTA